jgi:hypothetical protein
MVNRQLERQQMNRERRMAEDEQFQKVRFIFVVSWDRGPDTRERK